MMSPVFLGIFEGKGQQRDKSSKLLMNIQRWNDRLFKVEMFLSYGDIREEQVCCGFWKESEPILAVTDKANCEVQKRRAE
jgi:hypothetical protein